MPFVVKHSLRCNSARYPKETGNNAPFLVRQRKDLKLAQLKIKAAEIKKIVKDNIEQKQMVSAPITNVNLDLLVD
jgi:hypothetical protein